MNKRPLPALTGIRFFLAFWVVLYHQVSLVEPELSALPLQRWFMPALHTGYSAVTAFFVLSGFVLAYNYDLSSKFSPAAVRGFAGARFARIYPAYFVGLILLVPTALYRLAAGIEIAPPVTEWAHFVLNLLLLQSWFPDAALSWNFPGWSLSNEAFFYALFPFIGVLLWRARRPASVGLLLAASWVLACLAPLIAVWVPAYHWGDLSATTIVLPPDASVWTNIVRYNPLLRLPEFCAGILLAKIFSWIPSSHALQQRGFYFYLPAIVALFVLLTRADRIPYPLLHNGLLVPLFALLLLGLALGGGALAQWLSTPALVLLGNASYSIYILHLPVHVWLDIFFRRVLDLPPTGWLWLSCYLLAITVGACCFYQFVEKRLHRMLHSALKPRRGIIES